MSPLAAKFSNSADADVRRLAETLRFSEERFRKVFDESPLGMGLVEMDDRFASVNQALCRMLGYSEAELKQRMWQQITHPQDLREGEEQVRRLTRGEIAVYRTEKRYLRKDGSVMWGALTLSLVRAEDGRPLCRLVMVEDITDRKKQEQERSCLLRSEQTARAEAETANQRKDQMLAMMSHELRTPLTAVMAQLDLLERSPHDAAATGVAMRTIRRNLELEIGLINDLLDLTRITQGNLQLNWQRVDVHEEVRSALEICAAEMRQKNQQVTLDLGAGHHEMRADPARLEQVFWNLISNAVKYTPPGGSIMLRSRDCREGRVVVEVIDTGIGIEAEALPRLFRAFEQGEPTLTRRFGGLGLGLSIARALLEMQGGTIAVASEGKGRGSTFTVELPTLPAEPAVKVQAAGRPGRALRLLLVEDNRDTLGVMARLLRGQGYEVLTADSVATARQAAEQQDIDLLISDIGLPDGSGWELMRQLNAKHPLKGVAVSGFGTDEVEQRSRQAGFAACLTKPIDLNKLEEAIQRVAGAL